MKEKIDESLVGYPERAPDFCNLTSMTQAPLPAWVKCWIRKIRVTINYFAMPPSTFGAICKGWAKRS